MWDPSLLLRSTLKYRQLYRQSKLGNILISNHWSQRYGGVVVSTALHPGGIRTGLRRSFLHLYNGTKFPVQL
ncbi:hypothetical protein DFH07DRAFT_841790 [Mycena maculata]|uniref:Uncharacterized protein n=1 Tax=Mycena maculata TaxID=230809 RepID=A0AAD7IAZ8_9AGAR|nr:hypothetical protein DFH07DRAFT_841790 [Mycena maculata]